MKSWKTWFVAVAALLLWCGSLAQAEGPYQISMVEGFDNIPTQQVVASYESLEHALYNSVFDTEVLWKAFSQKDRRLILGKTHQTIGTGLGLRVLFPKVDRLRNVEFQVLPMGDGANKFVLIVTNVVQNKKGELMTVPLKSGISMVFMLDGEHLAVFNNYAVIYQLTEIERGLEKDPINKDFLLARASLYDMFDQRQAVYAYEDVIRFYPDEAVAYNNLAMLYTGYLNLNLLDPEQAMVNAKKACELTDYKNTGFVDTLARACFVNGDLEQAEELTQKNIAQDDQRVFHLFLEMVQARILGAKTGKPEDC